MDCRVKSGMMSDNAETLRQLSVVTRGLDPRIHALGVALGQDVWMHKTRLSPRCSAVHVLLC